MLRRTFHRARRAPVYEFQIPFDVTRAIEHEELITRDYLQLTENLNARQYPSSRRHSSPDDSRVGELFHRPQQYNSITIEPSGDGEHIQITAQQAYRSEFDNRDYPERPLFNIPPPIQSSEPRFEETVETQNAQAEEPEDPPPYDEPPPYSSLFPIFEQTGNRPTFQTAVSWVNSGFPNDLYESEVDEELYSFLEEEAFEDAEEEHNSDEDEYVYFDPELTAVPGGWVEGGLEHDLRSHDSLFQSHQQSARFSTFGEWRD